MINLMLCGNQKAFDGMIISILSIVRYTSQPIRLFILTMDLSELDAKYQPITEKEVNIINGILKTKNSASTVKLFDVTNYFKAEMMDSSNMKTHYTPYIFVRLFADKIQELPDKILYLDVDIVAYSDISELYNIDVNNYEFGAVLDYFGRYFISKGYLNSGVLLMNLKKMKENNSLEKVRKMCISKKMLLPDQSALNKICKKNTLQLPRKYNEQKDKRKDTVIRHFSMTIKFFPVFHLLNIKPWNIEEIHEKYEIHDFDDILEQYLKIKGTV